MKQGIKFANNPFDVRRCPDRNLLFSTDFMGMPIIAEGSVDKLIGTGSGSRSLYVHNLGYTPAILVYIIKDGKSYPATSNINLPFTYTFKTSSSEVSLDYQDSTVEDIYSFYLYIFAVPLERNIPEKTGNNSYIASENQLGRSGVSFAKKNTDIKDSKAISKIMHTRYPSFIIHKQEYGFSAVGFKEVSHNLGYPPMFLNYIQTSTSIEEFIPTDYFILYNMLQYSLFDTSGTMSSADKVTMFASGFGFNYSTIILKGAGDNGN